MIPIPQLRAASMLASRLAIVAAAVFLALGSIPRAVRADPVWTADPKAIVQITEQTGKGVVLYFESPKAADCIRMNKETWPKIDPAQANKDFIWTRLNPKDHAKFFHHYQVFKTPELILLDSRLRERVRFKGYAEDWVIMERLKEVPRGRPRKQTTPDGKVIDPTEALPGHALQTFIDTGHSFFSENFDGYQSIGAIRKRWFQAIRQADSRIDPEGGPDGSPCLVIDSGDRNVAAIRIDVSRRLDQVEQVVGRIRLRIKLRSLNLDDVDHRVVELAIGSKAESNAGQGPKLRHLTLSGAEGPWTDQEIISDPLNFRMNQVFINLRVKEPGRSFAADDIRVDLLPIYTPPPGRSRGP